jgi:predicted RNA binding protein YcfA (HicA-like mRNA interferase family)
MSKPPRDLSGKEVVKALGKAGFYFKRKKGKSYNNAERYSFCLGRSARP